MEKRKRKIKVVLALMLSLFSLIAEAKQTTYYTMLSTNGRVNKRECNMEGNQIVNNMLFGSGSQCRRGIPYTQRYCPWGIGNRDNCIVPCVHGAGHRSMVGKTVSVRGFTCPWGPLKGRWITKVQVADVGGMVGRGHTDVFTGICMKKKSDNCTKYAPEGTLASYGRGRGREEEMALALVNSVVGKVGQSAVASINPDRVPATAPVRSERTETAFATGVTGGFLYDEGAVR